MECAAWINTILPRCLQPLARAAQKLQKRRRSLKALPKHIWLRRKHGRKPELMKKQLINLLPEGILIIPPGSIGIVGSREASGYGLKAADAFAADLAAAGVVIVSGGARGIDTAAHRGALAAGGITVAVLGCGIDIAYPAANKNLFAQICERGALVTEYPPGTPPAAYNFPARNRIINGMTHGILVAEAAKKSGAMITAEYALEEGHEVYCVPGSIFLPTSIGCHSLIKSGAQLVDRPEDILESLKLASFPQQPALFGSGNGEDELDDNAKAVLKILSFEPLSLEEILEKSGLGLAEAGMGLLDLEMRGKVAQTAARSYYLL